MFSGIVEGKRRAVVADRHDGGLRLEIDLEDLAEGVKPGDSIAVRGCCLTVEALEGTRARFHLMGQTLSLTAFEGVTEGSHLNCERSLAIGDRLGGHFVSGHLDGMGRVASIEVAEGQTDITIEMPPELAAVTIPKGSVAIDGVSLTIARLQPPRLTVCLIPHTLEVTTLGELKVGDPVHLEMDMIGKWVQRLLGEAGQGPGA